jgi:hypothetical protein
MAPRDIIILENNSFISNESTAELRKVLKPKYNVKKIISNENKRFVQFFGLFW